MRIGTRCAEADWICDYVPGVSTFSNLIDLVQKGVGNALPAAKKKSRYWRHIRFKDTTRCLALTFLPVLGNVYYLVKDYSEYKKEKMECVAAIRSDIENKRSLASTFAMIASSVSGLAVSGAQMMPASREEEQALWSGCYTDSLPLVRRLLDQGISPNFYHSGHTPLSTACAHSSQQMVHLLLDYRADASVFDRYGNSPLISACVKGDIGIVRLLHTAIEDLDTANPKGLTPLMIAALQGNQALVTYLTEHGANPHKVAQDGSDAVSSALFKDQVEVLPTLLGQNAHVDTLKYTMEIPGALGILWLGARIENLTPLLYATLTGAVKSAHYLLPKSDVCRRDSAGSTVLHYSVRHIELLRAYLERCSTPEFVNAQNINGSTALHRAIELDQPESAMRLLHNNADPLIVNELRQTSLALACKKGYIDVVKYINAHHKIPAEFDEQVASALEAEGACALQHAPTQESSVLSKAFDLMQTGLEILNRPAEEIAKYGPEPRTGMELIFKKIPWPS